jgi:drug/metabolite transporter (DMT)-like permease
MKMDTWFFGALVISLCYGVSTVLLSKSSPIHGANVQAFFSIVGYSVLLAAVGFGRADFARITTSSFVYGAIAALLMMTGTYLFYVVIGRYEEQTALIDAVAATYPLVTAVLLHVFVRHMTGLQWLCIFVIVAGIIGLAMAPVLNSEDIATSEAVVIETVTH